jgi:hypothetical protein
MYPSELEFRSESWRWTEVHQKKYSCTGGVENPHLEFIKGLWRVQMYRTYRKMLLWRMVAVGLQ